MTSRTVRHSFVKDVLEDGQVIRTVRELLGQCPTSTTLIHTHDPNRGFLGVKSPLDRR